jgi:hypothetical protein
MSELHQYPIGANGDRAQRWCQQEHDTQLQYWSGQQQIVSYYAKR